MEPTGKYRELAEVSDEISRCGRCGFCQSVCPVYHVSGLEGSVARGRNMFAKALFSGNLELDRENEALLSECLLCRACVDACFSSVKTDQVVVAGRRARGRIHGLPPIHKYAFERLLPDPQRLGRFVRLARAGRPAARAASAALRLFGWFPSFTRAGEFLEHIPAVSLRERLARRGPHAALSKRAALFIGCGTNFMFPDAGEATASILDALGYRTVVVEHGCCGLPAHSHGAFDAAIHLARLNIERFTQTEGPIVTDCSSCASFLKDYPRLLSLDKANGETLARAESFSSRVRDMTEILHELSDGYAGTQCDMVSPHNRGVHPRRAENLRVTFHEPCHLGRGQRLDTLARTVLSSLPIEYVEMNEAAWCCGGAGAFALEHADLSLRILERKLQNFRATGAQVLVTTCPSCLMQLRSGLARSATPARVMHLTELVRHCK